MRRVVITLSKDFVLSQKRMKRGVVTFSLETNVFIQRYELIFYDGRPYRIETSLLICRDTSCKNKSIKFRDAFTTL